MMFSGDRSEEKGRQTLRTMTSRGPKVMVIKRMINVEAVPNVVESD